MAKLPKGVAEQHQKRVVVKHHQKRLAEHAPKGVAEHAPKGVAEPSPGSERGVPARRPSWSRGGHLDFGWFRVCWLPEYGWIVRRPPAVVIVPVAPDGSFWLVKIRRLPTRQTAWEFPGGGVGRGESAVKAARRELIEECGLLVRGPTRLVRTRFEAVPGMGSVPHRIVVAHGVVPKASAPVPQESEGICDIRRFSSEELRELVRRGRITVHATLVGLLAAGCLDSVPTHSPAQRRAERARS